MSCSLPVSSPNTCNSQGWTRTKAWSWNRNPALRQRLNDLSRPRVYTSTKLESGSRPGIKPGTATWSAGISSARLKAHSQPRTFGTSAPGGPRSWCSLGWAQGTPVLLVPRPQLPCPALGPQLSLSLSEVRVPGTGTSHPPGSPEPAIPEDLAALLSWHSQRPRRQVMAWSGGQRATAWGPLPVFVNKGLFMPTHSCFCPVTLVTEAQGICPLLLHRKPGATWETPKQQGARWGLGQTSSGDVARFFQFSKQKS